MQEKKHKISPDFDNKRNIPKAFMDCERKRNKKDFVENYKGTFGLFPSVRAFMPIFCHIRQIDKHFFVVWRILVRRVQFSNIVNDRRSENVISICSAMFEKQFGESIKPSSFQLRVSPFLWACSECWSTNTEKPTRPLLLGCVPL